MIDRRTFTLGAATLAVGLPALLAGCSSGTDASGSGTATGSSAPAEDATTGYPLTLTVYDAEGNEVEVTYEQAPERIVSTQLSITELLLTLGPKDKIVGIMDNDNAVDDELQAELDDLTSLGYKSTISKEAILAANPDIVMGKATLMFTDTAIGTVEDYLDLGINVYTQLASVDVIDQSLENIIEDVRSVGMIFDVQDEADAYADSLEEQLSETLETVSAQADGQEEISVLLMAGFQEGTFLAFSSTLHSVMLEAVNAVNVLETGGNGLTLENLISLSPDAIVYVTADRYAETDADAVERLLSEEAIQDVPAIANERIIEIGYDDIMDYGARVISTVGVLADFLYGE